MLGAVGTQAAEAWGALARVFRDPALRRLQLALAASVAGDWSASVAMSVLVFRHGGAVAVGALQIGRLVPAAVLAPFVAQLADRFPRRRVLLATDAARAGLVTTTIVLVVAGAPIGLVYVTSGVTAVVASLFWPTELALLPQLARDPEQLAAANVCVTTVEAASIFVGPALAGLLLAVASIPVALLLPVGAYLLSALLVSRLPGPAETPLDEREDQETAAGPGGLLAGFRAVLAHRTLRAVVALLAAQTLVAGAFNVLTVVAAIDLLHSGSSGLGLLLAACGIGGLVGSLPALVLGTRSRLSLSFAAGLLLWGLPIAVLGLWPNRAAAFVLLGLIGVGNTLVDVAGNTLLQRAAPEAVLARVFGVLESATMVAIAVGAALAPLLVSAIGARAALVAIGALLPVGTLLCWRRLSRLDTPDPAVLRRRDLLARVPILGPLPPAVRERLALAVREDQVAAGATVFRQGDLGDRFYAVADGSVDVEVDGRFARRLGVGDVFGEIALLHASPRTATVVAREPTTLYTLERSSFLAAVSAHPASAAAAEVVVGSRLGRSRLPAGSPDGAQVAAAR